MAKRFALNFSYPLDESPWKVAARWVTARQIHPENAKELGEFSSFVSNLLKRHP